MENISSPCILVCAMDEETGFCFGCGRSRSEIADWITMGEATRMHIMDSLPARLETMEPRRPRRVTKRRRMAQKQAKR